MEGLQLQQRDLFILRDLFESRVMTLGHIASMHFDGRAEAAKKRLQRLKSAGFIAERPRKAVEPSVLHLTPAAFELLDSQGYLAEYPRFSISSLEKRAQVSDLTIRHELEVMDVKTALVRAIARVDRFTVAEFSTWPRLNEFRTTLPPGNGSVTAETVVRPDGFIRVHEANHDNIPQHLFFLEVDRSTETLETFVHRAACYGSHYRSGDFAKRCGGERSSYKRYPFRVLGIFKSVERRNNVAERLLHCHPPIHSQLWLTTRAEIIDDPLGDTWIRPRDYRDILAGTAFDVRTTNCRLGGYARNVHRDTFVEDKIQKRKILPDE